MTADGGAGGLGRSLDELLALQQRLARELLGMGVDGFGRVLHGLGGATSALGALRPRSCCDIPEPCWMPQDLGEVACRLCPGGKGTVRLVVTNEELRPHTVVPVASGAAAGQVSFEPKSLPLGPKERGTITATFIAPDGEPGRTLEALVWLRGCRDHFLRWAVTVAKEGGGCCHELRVHDGQDHVLHWYDHFYCPRPCHGGRVPGPNG
jgi:hypothetical protein